MKPNKAHRIILLYKYIAKSKNNDVYNFMFRFLSAEKKNSKQLIISIFLNLLKNSVWSCLPVGNVFLISSLI